MFPGRFIHIAHSAADFYGAPAARCLSCHCHLSSLHVALRQKFLSQIKKRPRNYRFRPPSSHERTDTTSMGFEENEHDQGGAFLAVSL